MELTCGSNSIVLCLETLPSDIFLARLTVLTSACKVWAPFMQSLFHYHIIYNRSTKFTIKCLLSGRNENDIYATRSDPLQEETVLYSSWNDRLFCPVSWPIPVTHKIFCFLNVKASCTLFAPNLSLTVILQCYWLTSKS